MKIPMFGVALAIPADYHQGLDSLGSLVCFPQHVFHNQVFTLCPWHAGELGGEHEMSSLSLWGHQARPRGSSLLAKSNLIY